MDAIGKMVIQMVEKHIKPEDIQLVKDGLQSMITARDTLSIVKQQSGAQMESSEILKQRIESLLLATEQLTLSITELEARIVERLEKLESKGK